MEELDSALKEYYSKNRQNGSYHCLFGPLKKADNILWKEKGVSVLDFRNFPTVCRNSDGPLERLKTLAIEARNRIWEDNFGLIYDTIKRYYSFFRKANHDDLVSEGQIGILEAIRKYNPNMGIRFPTFAVPEIRFYILRVLHETKAIRLPVISSQHNYIEYFENIFKKRFKHYPTHKELADFFDINIKRIKNVRHKRDFYKILSLNYPVFSDEKAELMDTVADERYSPEKEIIGKISLEEKLSILSPREKSIVLRRLSGMTLEEVGKEENLTRARISQIELRAVRKFNKDKERWDISKKNLLKLIYKRLQDKF